MFSCSRYAFERGWDVPQFGTAIPSGMAAAGTPLPCVGGCKKEGRAGDLAEGDEYLTLTSSLSSYRVSRLSRPEVGSV